MASLGEDELAALRGLRQRQILKLAHPPPFHRHSCALVLPQQISIEWVVQLSSSRAKRSNSKR
jgi:hypothetical protein